MNPIPIAPFAAFALVVAACGEPAPVFDGPGLGAACDHDTPCADPAWTVCLGGACVERTTASPPATGLDVVAPIVIDVAAAAPDTATDAAADAGDVAEDVGGTALLWIGDHTAVDAPSGDALNLYAGQGAVAELRAPARGRLVVVEVIAREPPGGTSCAVYRPAAWSEDPDGGFAPTPAWEGAPVAVLGADGPQEVPIADGPELGPGAVRVGLVFEETCPDTARQPVLVLDASGDLNTTFLWIRGGAGTWVPGVALQLSGRWALRAGLEVPARGGADGR